MNTGIAQSETDNTIEFSFSTRKFNNKPLTFDEVFYMNLKDIPENINSIIISIKQKSGGSKTTTTSPVFERKLIRDIQFSGSTAVVAVDKELKHSTAYIIDFKGEGQTTLTKAEKDALKNILTEQDIIADFVNKVSKDILASSTPMFGNLSFAQTEFNRSTESIVKSINPNYQLKPIDGVPQLFALTDFASQLFEIKDKIGALKTDASVTGHANSANILKEINKFEQQLQSIDWGTVVSPTNTDFADLITTKNNIFSGFGGSLPGSVSVKKTTIETILNNIPGLIDKWINKTDVINNVIVLHINKASAFAFTYSQDFVENSRTHINLDIGLAYVGYMDRFVPYSGLNIYFRPVKKSIPPRNYLKKGWEYVGVTTSLLIGLTVNSIEKDNVRKGLIGNLGMLLGVGYRPISFLKINGGVMCYYLYNNNPLISKDRYDPTFRPFVSLSFDLDAKALFGGIGDSLFK
ncbi:hypothetical protein GCM10027442_37200 [Emticicia fontis]